jgi:hypothetical protein
MILSVCKCCRKRFTRSDKGLCRQSDECSNEIDNLGTAAFACCNEDIVTAGTIIVSAKPASRIIAKDVLLMLWLDGMTDYSVQMAHYRI